ncbi:MAG TPA: hypothetical protein VF766_01925 [Pyrinomonadaceae bacterium]
MRQPTFFEKQGGEGAIDAEQIVLYALGDFQTRGKVLARRDLPLDRLRGALRRATEAHSIEELSDEAAVAALRALGAEVRQVPSFVAKHPFRVIVPLELAERSKVSYQEILASLRQS